METGKIVQVLGPVVDVVFENGKGTGQLKSIRRYKTVTKNVLWKWHSI